MEEIRVCRYEEIDIDKILDMYLLTKDKCYLSYLFMKVNNLSVEDVCSILRSDYSTIFQYIYKIEETLII